MENLNQLVLSWANERNLLKSDNAPKQALKLTEEVGELASAILKSKYEEQVDAIGDIQVVLIILSEQLGINYELALETAYKTIADRKGKTVNGTFVREEN